MNRLMVFTVIVLSLLLIFLFVKRVIRRKRLRRLVLADGNSDYKEVAVNIALSISKSKELYKELITKVHPDRFTDERKEKAAELSSRITKAKKNYHELQLLKNEVESFMND